MNKTVTVNLGGMVFYIDENAYEVLSEYLRKIRMHFGKSDGAEEIISDIESRFAEIFNEKITGGKQVILMADVEAAIHVMGKPEDIAGEQAEEEQEKNYAPYSGAKSKRFYRNPDNKVLGGVCGGIGAYFDFDPLWLRLVFAVSFFFFGSGFLLYMVLWLIIPKAKTTAEKLAMRGEEVNISNIERSIKEEFENIKSQFKDFKKDAKSFSKGKSVNTAKSAIQEVIEFVSQVLSTLIKAVMKIFGVFFILIGMLVLVILGVALFQSMGMMSSSSVFNFHVSGYHTHNLTDLTDLFFTSHNQLLLAVISLCILVGVPFLRMMILGIKILFRINTRDFFINIVFGILWGVGLVLGIIVMADLASDFSREAEVSTVVPLQKFNSSTLYIDGLIKEEDTDTDSDTAVLFFHNVALRIVKSGGTEFELVKTNKARGNSMKAGIERANAINYTVIQNDSLILINPLIGLAEGERFRNQRIQLTLKVPQGKSVHLGYDLENISVSAKNDHTMHIDKMLGSTWMMGEKKLTCLDCHGF